MENQKLPNATAVLALGIISIVGCCCYGIVGLITGIIGLVLANKDLQVYSQNPSNYSNYSNLNIGRILCYIGIALSIIYILILIWMITTFGWENMQDPEALQQQMNQYFGVN